MKNPVKDTPHKGDTEVREELKELQEELDERERWLDGYYGPNREDLWDDFDLATERMEEKRDSLDPLKVTRSASWIAGSYNHHPVDRTKGRPQFYYPEVGLRIVRSKI